MNLLDYLIDDEKIKDYLHLYPVRDWSCVIKKTLRYGIESIQSFESAGLYSLSSQNREGGSHTKRESQKPKGKSKKTTRNSSRRKFSTEIERKKPSEARKSEAKKSFIIVDRKKPVDYENEHFKNTPKHRPIKSELSNNGASKYSFVKSSDKSPLIVLPEHVKEFYQNEFKQLLPENVPKRLHPMDLKLDDSSHIMQSSEFSSYI